MFRASGIGTYLRALLPRVVRLLPQARFCLLGDVPFLTQAFAGEPRVECRELSAGVYSPLEQLGIPRTAPSETRIFWSPNVNVPLVHPGRLLVTVHDAFYFEPPPGVRTRIDKRVYLGLLTRRLRQSASAILCDSEFTKSELERKWTKWPCPLHVVRIGIENDWFSKPSGENPWPKPYLVYVGNLKPHKNLPRTLAAFARIAERVPHDFLLIGTGESDALVRAIDPRLTERVHFLGSLENDAVKRHVAHASGLVLASLYEGFGLPPLEAMALGVPVLVARAASLPEVCGEAALYCDPLSIEAIALGLERLLSDDDLRARLAREGPANARRFDWDESARRTAEVIAGMLSD